MAEITLTPVAIYGDAVAGMDSTKVKTKLDALIATIDKSTIDVGELLYLTKSQGYYQSWGFNSFSEYLDSLKIKKRKSQYITRIVEVMTKLGIERTKYEPLGISKLREITSLDPEAIWTNPDSKAQTPISEFIKGFVDKGEDISLSDLKGHCKVLKGLTGENDIILMHFAFTQSAIESVIQPALEKAKMNIGSVSKDEDGISKDASDSRAVEVWAIEYLNDVNSDAN